MSEDERREPDLWDNTADWIFKHGALPALAVLTIGMAIIYRNCFAGETQGDDLTFHMAEASRIYDCLRHGDWDFWNNNANAGYASAYYYQAVPQLISAAPAALFGHFEFFFQLSSFLPYVLAPAAAYRAMRIFGATPWEAFFGAVCIGFLSGESKWGAGPASTFGVGLYTQTWALALFPLALATSVRWMQTREHLASAIGWGAFMGLCHPFSGVCLAVALIFGWLAEVVLLAVEVGLRAIAEALPPAGPGHEKWLALIAIEKLRVRWLAIPERDDFLHEWLGQLARMALLGVCLVITWAPVWVPLLVDYSGFGGFPHRVADEVGPGFGGLMKWEVHNALLDFHRVPILTWLMFPAAILVRRSYVRWLWAPVVVYALLLGIGPHVGKTGGDDLIPAVRFLGAMQVLMALGAGAGTLRLLVLAWNAPEGSPIARGARALIVGACVAALGFLIFLAIRAPSNHSLFSYSRTLTLHKTNNVYVWRGVMIGVGVALLGVCALAWQWLSSEYGMRTALAAGTAALGIMLVIGGATEIDSRVWVFGAFPSQPVGELHEIATKFAALPPGRKQVGDGATSHWWNLWPYVDGRRPALLQMGGAGLQSSRNYDELWTVHDPVKLARVYWAPYIMYAKTAEEQIPVGETVIETKTMAVRRLPDEGLISPVVVTGRLPAKKAEIAANVNGWLRGDEPNADHVLVYSSPPGPHTVSGVNPPIHGKTIYSGEQESPGDLADMYAVVEATEPTTFVARASWHPRWHAYLDSETELPVYRVSPDFPAVTVPAGHHTLQFRFERPWWATAVWLLWPLTPLAAWLVTWLLSRRRGSPSVEASAEQS
ncbi:MAG TPA: hypothetical protein VGM88_20805 [Kofleriaceae bacterium]|jgi:hypothetical protein